jgi:hypothetical protein
MNMSIRFHRTARFLFAGLLLLPFAAHAQESGGAPKEDVSGLLSEAQGFYDEGLYQSAMEALDRARTQLEKSHTLRDRALIEQTILDYAFHVIQGEYGEAMLLLAVSQDPQAEDEWRDAFERIHKTALKSGLELSGLKLASIEFTDPEKASARAVASFTGLSSAEVTLRLSKPYLDAWVIEGFPAEGAALAAPTRLMPLAAHSGYDGPLPKPRPKASEIAPVAGED